ADPTNTQGCMNGTVLASCTPDHFVTTDDPRLSDDRNPTAGSEFYIQNQNAASQNGNFNISGNGVIGGTLAVGSSDITFKLPAVTARSFDGQGVIGESRSREGVVARSTDGTALLAVSDRMTAIVAKSATGGTAVDVQSPMGQGMVIRSLITGVDVESTNGTGIVVRSSQKGTTGIDVDTMGTGVLAKGFLVGVDAEGAQLGVRGKGTAGYGGDFTGAAGGVRASGPYGVIADGAIAGVVGTSEGGIGVQGTGETGVSGTGAIGVYGTTNTPGGFAAKFEGNVQITGVLINPSDVRLKKDIHTLGYGLKDVMRLRPVTWVWKDRPAGGTQLGFIAQEVEAVMPELVSTIKNTEAQLEEMKGLNYIGFVPVLISSVQE